MHKLKRFASKRKVLLIRTIAICIPMCLILLLSQTAFAKNTYVITDGDRVITYTSSATDPRQVLGEAGLELDEDDTYTTQEGNGISEITVRRNQTIYINYYGEEMTATSHGETVEELLSRLNLSLGENDTISWPLSDTTYDGMRLRVENVIHQEQTYTTTSWRAPSRCRRSSGTGQRSARSLPSWPWMRSRCTYFLPWIRLRRQLPGSSQSACQHTC